MGGRIVNVKRSYEVRGLTFPGGQSFETWLPRGLWEVCGKCSLRDRDGDYRDALMLRRPVPMIQDGVWYVGVGVV